MCRYNENEEHIEKTPASPKSALHPVVSKGSH
jgi:hypothetical protein